MLHTGCARIAPGPEIPLETTLATSQQVLDRLMRLHGIDAGAMFLRHGIDPALLAEPRARLPIDRTDALIATIAGLVEDPAFGLDAARCWHPSSLGPLGHAWLASSTLRKGLERIERYGRLLGQRASCSVRDEPGGVAVVLDNPRRDPTVAAITTDMAFSVLLDMCRTNAGASFAPLEVRLVRPEPPGAARYAAAFGCPVVFGAAERSMLLPREAVEAALPTGNRELVGLLDGMLADDLARLERTDTVARCKALLLRRLASGEVTATQVSRDLAMSRRTLHRRLADAGTTWQHLVDETRRELAMRLIEDRWRPIGEITFELGFSQQSAFARAFRRWAGASPTAYRERLQQAIPA
jgi:AraC-like DNA-binding protein